MGVLDIETGRGTEERRTCVDSRVRAAFMMLAFCRICLDYSTCVAGVTSCVVCSQCDVALGVFVIITYLSHCMESSYMCKASGWQLPEAGDSLQHCLIVSIEPECTHEEQTIPSAAQLERVTR